ncbi:MAG TPA: type I DNA topoisomerase [Terriglobales bacterium]|nr:type I DNA topoisomerase [Terriglobales bacterium]
MRRAVRGTRKPGAPAGAKRARRPTPGTRRRQVGAAPRTDGARPARRTARAATAPAAGRSSGKALVVVESPTKSRTLSKFLGRGFTVLASNGHIMDLPKRDLGVDVENEFEPTYVPLASKAKAVARIRSAAQNAERIYLAPDPDREGEAIAWHLSRALEDVKRPIARLTFNEITERAVKEALREPRGIDMQLVNAQQARRVLDRLVGYKVSPVLWKRFYFGLSAGRVQSVALRLICEREEEIRLFTPEEYWTVEADFAPADRPADAAARFTAKLVRVGEEELEQAQVRGEDAGARAQALAAELAGAPARVATVDTQPRQVHPRAPFITSTLQQTAFNRLGFAAQRTMKVAQQLYEIGFITYMRTDSPRLAGEAIAEMRAWLARELGAEYVPESPRQHRGKKGAQDAHEAIRPTSVERTPASVRGALSDEQARLYELIWTRALASQAASAEYLATTAEIESGRLGLRASGRVLKFAGFQKLYGLDEDETENGSSLPELAPGMALVVAGEAVRPDAAAVRPEQHFTQPPPRYTEASLVKTLEEQDIGRPSTYATIVGTITSREYVTRDRGRLAPTELGMAVNRALVDGFPDVFTVDFTSKMEDELDEVEDGRQEWHRVVQDFWGPFHRDLEKSARGPGKAGELTDKPCPVCGKKLRMRFNRRGAYYACSGYPKCKYTEPVDPPEPPQPVEGVCPKCGAGLVARTGPFGRYVSCERRPECDFTRPFTLGIACPRCGTGELAEKRSRRGKVFYGCSRYPECDYALWDRPVATPCPQCGAAFLTEKITRQSRSLRCVNPGCGYRSAPEPVGA